MANVLNIIKTRANSHFRYAIKCVKYNNLLQSQERTLYSLQSLGIDNYNEQRTRTQTQLSNIADKFKSKMIDYTSEDASNMIFTEDLKNMIHIAEDPDVDLVIKMMERFNAQNKQVRFGNFVFGPVVMRMFHHLNKPDEALQCFNSPKLEGFFDQLMSYQVLTDLLYENQKYQEVIDTFKTIQSRQIEGTKFPKNIVVLTFAACYKINTQESLKFALELWSLLNEAAHLPMRRAVTFCGGLALRQGQPEATLEIISSTKNQNYTTVRNLKVAALCDIGRIEDVIPILKSVLNHESPMKHTFNKDVMEKVKQAVEKSDNIEIKQEFNRIEKQLVESDHLSDLTLDQQLCLEIATPPFVSNKSSYNNQQNQSNFRYNRYQRNNQDRFSQNRDSFASRRPGLHEMQ